MVKCYFLFHPIISLLLYYFLFIFFFFETEPLTEPETHQFRLGGQCTPRISLSLPQGWHYVCVAPHLTFYVGAEPRLRSLPVHGKHCLAKPPLRALGFISH